MSDTDSAPSPVKKIFKRKIPPRRVKIAEKSPRLEAQPDRGGPKRPNHGRGQSERRLVYKEAFQPRPRLVQVCFILNCNLFFT